MTEINITNGDNGTIIVTTHESSAFKFYVEVMGGKSIDENRWVLSKERLPSLLDLLRREFGRTGPPVEVGPYLVHHTEMEIRSDSALLAGDKIAGLKDSRDRGVSLSDNVIPCHGATYSVRERNGRTELSLEGDFIVFGAPSSGHASTTCCRSRRKRLSKWRSTQRRKSSRRSCFRLASSVQRTIEDKPVANQPMHNASFAKRPRT